MIDYDQKQFATEEFVDVRQFLFRSLKIQRALDGFTCTPEAALLDLGCGEGAFARTLKKLFPEARISGCDISEAQLACARDLVGHIQRFTHRSVLRLAAEQGFVCRRYRFFWILRRIAYWESRLLGRLSLEFGTDARFE